MVAGPGGNGRASYRGDFALEVIVGVGGLAVFEEEEKPPLLAPSARRTPLPPSLGTLMYAVMVCEWFSYCGVSET